MRRWLLRCSMAGLALAGLSLAGAIALHVDPALRRHGDAVEKVRRLQLLEARRNRLLMRVRYRTQDDHDPLDESTRVFGRLMRELRLDEDRAGLEGREGGDDLRSMAARAFVETERVEEMVGDFETAVAALRMAPANLDDQARVDDLRHAIVTGPLDEALQGVWAWHDVRIRAMEHQRRLMDGALVLVAGALIALVAPLLVAQRRSRMMLEARVADRTRALGELNDNLRRANEAKTTFLANMSHEIRTPLTAVLGYADLLDQPDLTSADRRDLIAVIRRSGGHLLAIIDDILDLTKIEAGGMRMESIDCSPRQIVEEVCEWMRRRAEEKGLALTVAVAEPAPLPNRIRSDPTRLRQILVNLIGNAIKFTSRGGVRVGLDYREGRGHGRLVFTVGDTGVGMTAEQMAHIFEDFSQADSSTSRKFGGTGLGLAICRRLVTALGGTLKVSSRLGTGSEFTFELPLGEDQLMVSQRLPLATLAEITTADAPLPALPSGVHVLLADDSPDNQLLVTSFLTAAGAKVSSVFNGNEAVRAAVASARVDAAFSLILMDLQMPELGGLEALAELRRAGIDIPVVALTASALDEDRAHCIEAGCAGFLSKPVDRRALLQTVVAVVRARPSRGSPETSVRAPEPRTGAAGPVFDPARMLALVGGDLPLRDTLLDMARVELPKQLAAIEEAATAGDVREAAVRAHRMKGALASICAERAVAVALGIERAGAPASTVGAAEISRSLSSLRGELAELDEAIGAFRSAANGR